MDKAYRRVHIDDEPLVTETWEKFDHYKVVDYPNKSGRCLILCSSHGLLEDFSTETFIKQINELDRYELKNTVDNSFVKKKYQRVIYVRDIWGYFYIRGINSRVDSIKALIDLLKPLTEGYLIVTAGISAGGYLATILGCEFKAEMVLSFGGQFEIENNRQSYWRQYYAEDSTRNKFFNIVDMVEQSQVDIFFFLPVKSERDIHQAGLVEGAENVHFFCFSHDKHGPVVSQSSFKYLLSADKKKMTKWYKKFYGRSVSTREFGVRTVL